MVVEFDYQGGIATIQGECESVQTEATTRDYPGAWEIVWTDPPSIESVTDEDGNEIEVTKEMYWELLELASDNYADFMI